MSKPIEVLNKAAITGTLQTDPCKANEQTLVFYITNSTEDSLTFYLKVGAEWENTTTYYSVVDPYTDSPISFAVAAGGSIAKTFTDLMLGQNYKLFVTTTGATGNINVKVSA